MSSPGDIERVCEIYERTAATYDSGMRLWEKLLFGGGRQWLCGQATGAVLEIGIGTGRNLPYYPAEVRLTGVDLSPAMIAIARERAAALGREVELRVGDAQELEFPAECFDTVVAALALCTIPDPYRAVSEAKRVLRPGGRFLLLEHVRSPLLPVRLGQRLLEPLSVRFAADHLLREPLDDLTAVGFIIERVERSKWGIVERVAARNPT